MNWIYQVLKTYNKKLDFQKIYFTFKKEQNIVAKKDYDFFLRGQVSEVTTPGSPYPWFPYPWFLNPGS